MRHWHEEPFTNCAKACDMESFFGTLGENVRFFAPSEIFWYLSSPGLIKSSIHGSHLGSFSRDPALTTDDFEMLVIAEK